MHTVPYSPSTPIGQGDLSSGSSSGKLEETSKSSSSGTTTMAVCQPVVSAKEPAAANAMETKPVVTPDSAKASDGSPTPTAADSEWLQRSPVSAPSTGSNSNAAVDEDSSQGDSSDGESSYFAKHLPSPKSGRRFSYSSAGSAPARTAPFRPAATPGASQTRASDASLSFSDESDDELPLSEPVEPIAQLPSRVADMQLQRITRVHSVSSLVSSDTSNNSHPKAGVMSPESTLSRDSTNSSVNAEHSTVVASPKDSAARHRQPENPYLGFYQGHPAMNPYGPYAMQQHQMMMAAQIHQQQLNQFTNVKTKSDGTLPFVYSDDETEDTPFMHQLATDGQGGGAYNTFPSQGGNGGSSGSGGNDAPAGSNGGDPYARLPGGQNSNESQGANGAPLASGQKGHGPGDTSNDGMLDEDQDFKVYWQRWIMLFYMSVLNLLSDWTCYSVAPIAILTQQTFGDIDPERLVVIFLGANAISTACEPIILARLGLKKTVLVGALFLMLGSIVKSGGIPPFVQAELVRGEDEWRLSFGFFLVGLSQPLYQCTPALLSASWFPEQERTMATGVALNANQLGIGCAFVFGTLLVATSDDIPSYFGLLSIISTLAFFGTLFQFDDAPPTPPSSSAKVMKGDITVPDVGSIMQSVRGWSANISPTANAAAPAPSPAISGRTPPLSLTPHASAPSPMDPGPTNQENQAGRMPLYADTSAPPADALQGGGPPGGFPIPPEGFHPHPSYQYPYAVPGMPPHPYYQQQPYFYPPMVHPSYAGYQNAPYPGAYPPPHPLLQGPGYGYDFDEGAEPVVTVSDHHLDIEIRDDQIIQSTRACLARPGFIHCLVSFTVSGIVINTLSTFMDYLVTLNGAGREYVGIIGGSFQGIIMASSLIIGKQTDKTRAYYSVIIAMLVFGAFGLAQSGVSLDADRGSDLRYSLLIVAALVGPLQPVSTELGVEVAYPLSENTVLVIQQLFSNLLSALFIPFFKSLKDIGISRSGTPESGEQPEYTFSFYLLILLHAAATVFFATFKGRYLRYEHELEKLAAKEQKKMNGGGNDGETTPLTGPTI